MEYILQIQVKILDKRNFLDILTIKNNGQS